MLLWSAALVAVLAGCHGHNAAALHRRLLSQADLPTGWSLAHASAGNASATTPSCLAGLTADSKSWTDAKTSFVQGPALPAMTEVLVTGPDLQARWQRVRTAMSTCKTATIDIGGKQVASTIKALSLPKLGDAFSSFAWTFTTSQLTIGLDLVLFDTGQYAGYLAYTDLSPPDPAAVEVFANAAAAKAKVGKTDRIPDSTSITSTPEKKARTALGIVAYRSIGTGPPLVLITGYGGRMEGWDRRFVDALAQHHRVIILDNAGIGKSANMAGALTIDAMAEQTSALIQALNLERADVLGWSMGSMIAQALAVLHPAQVRRLILCASYPGNGTAKRPSTAAIDALGSADPAKAMADLFPADQTAAQTAYLTALTSWPAAPPTPATTITAQARAIDAWWNGTDPAGKRTPTITAPTLVADGTADRLDATANSHALAALLPHATLLLYADAGHAFLFQEQHAFLTAIEAFLD